MIKYRDYKSYDQTTISAKLSDVNWDIVYNTLDSPINKSVKGKPALWLNADVKLAMNHREKLNQIFLKSKSNPDVQNCTKPRKKHSKTYTKNARQVCPERFWKIPK